MPVSVRWTRTARISTTSVKRMLYTTNVREGSAEGTTCSGQLYSFLYKLPGSDDSLLASTGMVITLTELSAEPEINSVPDGLNLSEVTGKSCAFKMVRIG